VTGDDECMADYDANDSGDDGAAGNSGRLSNSWPVICRFQITLARFDRAILSVHLLQVVLGSMLVQGSTIVISCR
jgi:hypothetical protein